MFKGVLYKLGIGRREAVLGGGLYSAKPELGVRDDCSRAYKAKPAPIAQ